MNSTVLVKFVRRRLHRVTVLPLSVSFWQVNLAGSSTWGCMSLGNDISIASCAWGHDENADSANCSIVITIECALLRIYFQALCHLL